MVKGFETGCWSAVPAGEVWESSVVVGQHPRTWVRFFLVENIQVIEEFKGRLLLRGVGKDKRKKKSPKN